MLSRKTSILFVVNDIKYFLSHRLPIALAAQKIGYDIKVAGPPNHKLCLETYNFEYHYLPLDRMRQNPIKECLTIIKLFALFKKLSPDIVHLVTIKPMMYGGIAARLTNAKSVVFAVSGLGSVFLDSNWTGRIRKCIVLKIYAYVFKHKNHAVIFQNFNDALDLQYSELPSSKSKFYIKGSGVNIKKYKFLPEPTGRTIVVMASRLLKDKGVLEFVKSAKYLWEWNVDVEMRLIGDIDEGNPSSLTHSDIAKLKKYSFIKFLGYQTDIERHYKNANIICLPSYREGLPKSLIEAAACGRAIVTTDVPGCRDTIIDGKTGILVPPKDPLTLAEKIKFLSENKSIRIKMGKEGRKFAEKTFDINLVVKKHLEIYDYILEKGEAQIDT